MIHPVQSELEMNNKAGALLLHLPRPGLRTARIRNSPRALASAFCASPRNLNQARFLMGAGGGERPAHLSPVLEGTSKQVVQEKSSNHRSKRTANIKYAPAKLRLNRSISAGPCWQSKLNPLQKKPEAGYAAFRGNVQQGPRDLQ